MKARIEKTRLQELTVYVLIWAGALAAPIVDHYLDTLRLPIDYDWTVVLNPLLGMLPFFVVFWLHDIFVAPYILKRGQRSRYVVGLVVLLALFAGSQWLMRPQNRHFDVDEAQREGNLGKDPIHEVQPPQPLTRLRAHVTGEPLPPPRPDQGPATPLGLMHFAMAAMLCGLNVGVKFYFKTRRDEMARIDVERHQLQKELELLTYQINPHFFMNTLNNIRVLIDLDPAKAKYAIIELSKILRYTLYDTADTTVSLTQELECLRHYIELMRLRYTEAVDITAELPEQVPDANIPPMLLITFIENAFKHGISYRQPSFVHTTVTVEGGQVTFTCRNSVAPRRDESHGGVGLDNVRKRLELIYGKRHTLTITNDDNQFSVTLILPTHL